MFTYSFIRELRPGKQLFYLGVDSIILILYATVLIALTIVSKSEKMRDLFEVGELLRCDVESDDHEMYVREEPRHQKGESVVEPLTTEC